LSARHFDTAHGSSGQAEGRFVPEIPRGVRRHATTARAGDRRLKAGIAGLQIQEQRRGGTELALHSAAQNLVHASENLRGIIGVGQLRGNGD
jgi:hypothetical protein